jgi:hypothetical protein
LQVKFSKPLAGQNDFVAYVDAIGELDDTPCLIEWKTTASRYPEEPVGLLALDPPGNLQLAGRVEMLARRGKTLEDMLAEREAARAAAPTSAGGREPGR